MLKNETNNTQNITHLNGSKSDLFGNSNSSENNE